MSTKKLTDPVPDILLRVVERCASAALVAIGVAGATQVPSANAAVSGDEITAAAESNRLLEASAGAIHLSLVTTDPISGEELATHWSHASHGSHASHYSHYSSRP